ncbi:YwqJ-related putative deaminase [Chitinimonas lacunae]|uniref:YwqJ-related putative deaminase n=1 Tax=Chitinimonas lacunae TaxID=1963018 RepID=A0ABV8MKW5_9NEIS
MGLLPPVQGLALVSDVGAGNYRGIGYAVGGAVTGGTAYSAIRYSSVGRVVPDSAVTSEIAALNSMATKNASPAAQLLHQRINLRGAVADEYVRLTQGMSNNRIRNEVGPVLAGVMDSKTGQIYYGLNKGVGELPDNMVPVLADRMSIAQEIPYIKTHGAGTHAEIHALNDAFLARPSADISDFLLYTINAGQRGSPAKWGTPVPRCPHCEFLTDGVQYFPASLRYGQ